jgi:hypothetical protein
MDHVQASVNGKGPENIDLTASLGELTPGYLKFCKRVQREVAGTSNGAQDLAAKLRRQLSSDSPVPSDQLALRFCQAVVLDLAEQGWKLKVQKKRVLALPPDIGSHDKTNAKNIIRTTHLFGRDLQLAEKSVHQFITGMERRRLTARGWHSVFSLMRDGPDLAKQLQRISGLAGEAERTEMLSRTITPYLQFVEHGAVCEHTGLRLQDIWRYFRHTWVNEYKSIPGRSISILIRDAASPNHPVIGIAGLGSSVAQHKVRDKWIGWHPESISLEFDRTPSTETVKWLLVSAKRLIGDIYIKDLVNEGLLRREDIKRPDENIVLRLLQEADRAIVEHRKEPQRVLHTQGKAGNQSAKFWEREAQTFLYRAKRCKQMSKLLDIRRVFQEHGLSGRMSNTELTAVFKSRTLVSTVAQLVRMVKGEHMGIDMMDITVCGAVAPYNSLLGGKLVCMLLCSPEITNYYSQRYGKKISVIASAMKGRPVVRWPNLVLLCTTSLYGVGSSQYNRVRIPLNQIGIKSGETVAYEDLGHSHGYGTYHFSRVTVDLGSCLNARKKGGRRVNSIFGEGVNPLMRKIRESLDSVGLNSGALLQHGNQRVTYGVRLAKNFREILLGKETEPEYLIQPRDDPKKETTRIATYWIRRWLSGRINRSSVLDDVSKNVLSFPLVHGAIVPLDRTDDVET